MISENLAFIFPARYKAELEFLLCTTVIMKNLNKERGRRLSTTPNLPGKLPYRIDDSDLEEEATGYGKP